MNTTPTVNCTLLEKFDLIESNAILFSTYAADPDIAGIGVSESSELLPNVC